MKPEGVTNETQEQRDHRSIRQFHPIKRRLQ